MTNQREAFEVHEISTNSWPAKLSILYKGWVLRISEGYTGRANSVYPVNYHGTNLEKDIAVVEQIYARVGLTCSFQITDFVQPPNLADILNTREYHKERLVNVMTGSNAPIASQQITTAYKFQLSEHESDEWIQANARMDNIPKDKIIALKKILERIQVFPKAFVTAWDNDKIVGTAMGVIEQNYMGLFKVIVDSEYRRQKIAAGLLSTLARWAVRNHGYNTYLQVMKDNFPAINLYHSLGYSTLYNYYYLEKTIPLEP